MKLIFIASVAGIKKFNNDYKLIISLLHKNNCTVNDDYVFKLTPEVLAKNSTTQFRVDFKKLVNEIKKADALIIEGSKSSIGVGRYLGVGLQYHKPILVLYQTVYPRALIDESGRLTTIIKYSTKNISDLNKKIKVFLNLITKKRLTYRFNLMLDEEMNLYLKNKAKKQRISKANYVRRIVSKDMRKDFL